MCQAFVWLRAVWGDRPWEGGVLTRPRSWRFQGQTQEVGGHWLQEEERGEKHRGLSEGMWGCLILWRWENDMSLSFLHHPR